MTYELQERGNRWYLIAVQQGDRIPLMPGYETLAEAEQERAARMRRNQVIREPFHRGSMR